MWPSRRIQWQPELKNRLPFPIVAKGLGSARSIDRKGQLQSARRAARATTDRLIVGPDAGSHTCRVESRTAQCLAVHAQLRDRLRQRRRVGLQLFARFGWQWLKRQLDGHALIVEQIVEAL